MGYILSCRFHLHRHKFSSKKPRDGTSTTGKCYQVESDASHATERKQVLIKFLSEEKQA